MNRIQKIGLILGLLFQIPLTYGMELADLVMEQQELDVGSLREVHKATISRELRACLTSGSNVADILKFKRLLRSHPWLDEYIAADGLTIGEIIVMLCKKEYGKALENGDSVTLWLDKNYSGGGPLWLVDLFEFVIQRISKKKELCYTIRNIATNSNTLNKIYYRMLHNTDNRTIKHPGAEFLAGRMNDLLSFCQVPFYLRSLHNKRALSDSITWPSTQELAVIKEADNATIFFFLIESREIGAVMQLLEKEPKLACGYKPAISSEQDYLSDSLLSASALTPLEVINKVYQEGLDGDAMQCALQLIACGQQVITQERYETLSQELKASIDEYRKQKQSEPLVISVPDLELIPEVSSPENIVVISAPDLDLVTEVNTPETIMEKLRGFVDSPNLDAFKTLLSANPWLRDAKANTGETIGEHIIEQYKLVIWQAIQENSRNGHSYLSIEHSNNANILCEQFKEVLKGCSKGSSTLLKIDRSLFYFYKSDFLHKEFSMCWNLCPIWIDYGKDLTGYDRNNPWIAREKICYEQSRLHRLRSCSDGGWGFEWKTQKAMLGDFTTTYGSILGLSTILAKEMSN